MFLYNTKYYGNIFNRARWYHVLLEGIRRKPIIRVEYYPDFSQVNCLDQTSMKKNW